MEENRTSLESGDVRGSFLARAQKAELKVSGILGAISGLLSFGLVILITTDVVIRWFRIPMSGTLEISRLTLAWICFSALVYTYTSGSHVRVAIFSDRFRGGWKTFVDLLSISMGLFLMGSLFWRAVPFFIESWKVKEIFNVDIDLPYWLAKLSVVVGTFAFGLAYIVDFILEVVGAKRHQ